MDERASYKKLVPKDKELPKTEGYEKWSKFGDRFHLPKSLSKKSKMSYKSGSPLKRLLSHKGATIKVGGY